MSFYALPFTVLTQVYKKKTETAKKEYLKQLAAYRANLVSQGLLGSPTEGNEQKKILTQSVTASQSPTTMSPQQLSPMMDTYSPEGPCMVSLWRRCAAIIAEVY